MERISNVRINQDNKFDKENVSKRNPFKDLKSDLRMSQKLIYGSKQIKVSDSKWKEID